MVFDATYLWGTGISDSIFISVNHVDSYNMYTIRIILFWGFFITVTRVDGEIVYTVWNILLWALSAIIILGLLLSLLALHIILVRRQKTREKQERSKMLLKDQPPAFVRTSTTLINTARNGKAFKKVQPENDMKICDMNDLK